MASVPGVPVSGGDYGYLPSACGDADQLTGWEKRQAMESVAKALEALEIPDGRQALLAARQTRDVLRMLRAADEMHAAAERLSNGLYGIWKNLDKGWSRDDLLAELEKFEPDTSVKPAP